MPNWPGDPRAWEQEKQQTAELTSLGEGFAARTRALCEAVGAAAGAAEAELLRAVSDEAAITTRSSGDTATASTWYLPKLSSSQELAVLDIAGGAVPDAPRRTREWPSGRLASFMVFVAVVTEV